MNSVFALGDVVWAKESSIGCWWPDEVEKLDDQKQQVDVYYWDEGARSSLKALNCKLYTRNQTENEGIISGSIGKLRRRKLLLNSFLADVFEAEARTGGHLQLMKATIKKSLSLNKYPSEFDILLEAQLERLTTRKGNNCSSVTEDATGMTNMSSNATVDTTRMANKGSNVTEDTVGMASKGSSTTEDSTADTIGIVSMGSSATKDATEDAIGMANKGSSVTEDTTRMANRDNSITEDTARKANQDNCATVDTTGLANKDKNAAEDTTGMAIKGSSATGELTGMTNMSSSAAEHTTRMANKDNSAAVDTTGMTNIGCSATEYTAGMTSATEDATWMTSESSSATEDATGMTNKSSSGKTSLLESDSDYIPESDPESVEYKLPSLNEYISESASEEELTFEIYRKKNGKRQYDKKHCCYFCDRLYPKIGRHLLTHKRETEIAKLQTYPVKSREKTVEILKLERLGDFYHNMDILSSGSGNLITLRRPTEDEANRYTARDYTPCPECYGFVIKKDLWRHLQRCPINVNKTRKEISCNGKAEGKRKRQALAESSLLLQPILSSIRDENFSKDVVASMMDDEIADIVKADSTVLHLGLNIYEKYGKSQKNYITQVMRVMGRFLQVVRRITNSPLKPLDFFINCSHFDVLVKAVRELCGDVIDKRGAPETGIPSLALKIGYNLRKCCKLIQGQALRTKDDQLKAQAKDFQSLLDLEWTNKVSSKALRTLYNRKHNKPQILPLTEDLVKLSTHLKQKTEEMLPDFQIKPTANLWLNFARVLLCRIIMFNKRRGGEASRILVEEYTSLPDWKNTRTQETEKCLSPLEQKLCERLTLIETRGKKGRKVPVLLQPDVKDAVDLLLQTRQQVGVNEKNPYVFARPCENSVEPLRGPDALRDVIKEVELEKPEAITSTNMRKYVSTVVQVMNLTENETGWLAKHLGHDIRVHHEFYRLHESTTELAKISRILLAVDKGNMSKFAGKNLESITMSDFSDNEDSEPLRNTQTSDATQEEVTDDEENAIMEKERFASQESGKNKNQRGKQQKDFSVQMEIGKEPERDVHPLRKHKQTHHTLDFDAELPRKNKPNMKWSTLQKNLMKTHFHVNIKTQKTPGKAECETFLTKYLERFQGREWKAIKFWVYNYIVTCKRQMKKNL